MVKVKPFDYFRGLDRNDVSNLVRVLRVLRERGLGARIRGSSVECSSDNEAIYSDIDILADGRVKDFFGALRDIRNFEGVVYMKPVSYEGGKMYVSSPIEARSCMYLDGSFIDLSFVRSLNFLPDFGDSPEAVFYESRYRPSESLPNSLPKNIKNISHGNPSGKSALFLRDMCDLVFSYPKDYSRRDDVEDFLYS